MPASAAQHLKQKNTPNSRYHLRCYILEEFLHYHALSTNSGLREGAANALNFNAPNQ